LFNDNRIKELLITERGLRVIYQLAQAEKSRYLVFRMAEFEEMNVNPEFLGELMNDMLALRDNVAPKS
jgi:exonuclease I